MNSQREALNRLIESMGGEGSDRWQDLPADELWALAWQAATKQGVSVPNEHGKNRYGLDMAYFRNLFNRELNRPLVDFRPDELARVLARESLTADSSVLLEPEFQAEQGVGEPVAFRHELDMTDGESGLLPESHLSETDDIKSVFGDERLEFAAGFGVHPTVRPLYTHPPKPTEGDLTIDDYKEAFESHRKMVRELDVLINGEEGAAEQASLCDLAGQIQKEGIVVATKHTGGGVPEGWRMEYQFIPAAGKHFINIESPDGAVASLGKVDRDSPAYDPFSALLYRLCAALLATQQPPEQWAMTNFELGRSIYNKALSDRRGFRQDQMGVDADVWDEIFEAIGQAARELGR